MSRPKNTTTVGKPCSFCSKADYGFPIDHDDKSCSFRQAMYCSKCAKYGHPTFECPVKNPSWATEPIYLEQLIPADDLKRHDIRSRTFLNGGPLSEGTLKEMRTGGRIASDPSDSRLIDVIKDDLCIKNFLRSNGYEASESHKRNMILMDRFEKENGVVINYLPGTPDEIIKNGIVKKTNGCSISSGGVSVATNRETKKKKNQV